jgi:hypothetical protein
MMIPLGFQPFVDLQGNPLQFDAKVTALLLSQSHQLATCNSYLAIARM